MPPGRLDFATSWSTMIFAWLLVAQGTVRRSGILLGRLEPLFFNNGPTAPGTDALCGLFSRLPQDVISYRNLLEGRLGLSGYIDDNLPFWSFLIFILRGSALGGDGPLPWGNKEDQIW